MNKQFAIIYAFGSLLFSVAVLWAVVLSPRVWAGSPWTTASRDARRTMTIALQVGCRDDDEACQEPCGDSSSNGTRGVKTGILSSRRATINA